MGRLLIVLIAGGVVVFFLAIAAYALLTIPASVVWGT